MPDALAPIEVFCSYAHEDERLFQKLETHLSVLKRQGLISIRHDRHIVPGTDWAHANSDFFVWASEPSAIPLLL